MHHIRSRCAAPGRARFLSLLLSVIFATCAVLAGPGARAAKPSPVASVPLEQVCSANGTAFLVPVRIGPRKSLKFLVDTASAVTIITPRVRTALGPDVRLVGAERMNGSGGTVAVETVMLPDLSIGRYTRHDIGVAVLDLSHSKRWIGRTLDGILGADLLRRFDVRIDAPGGTLQLFEPGRAGLPGTAAGFARVPVETTPSGFLRFAVHVDGAMVDGLLDSGANRHLLNRRAATELRLPEPDEADALVTMQEAMGADGRTFRTVGRRMGAITAGGASLGSPEASIGDLPVFTYLGLHLRPAIIVGAEALRDRVTWIAYSAGAIYLQRTDGPPAARPA